MDAIENEINESEAIVAWVIDCKLKIEQSSVGSSPSSRPAIATPVVPQAKPRLPKLTLQG